MVPGTRALAFVARWFDPSTVSNVFEPLIADWQREWIDSPRPRRTAVWLSGALALTVSIVAATPKVLLAPWPAPGVLRRILTRVVLWTCVLSMLLMFDTFSNWGAPFDARTSAYLMVLLLPSTIVIALPFASATIVDVIRSGVPATREERVAALRCGVALPIVMLMLTGWVFPAANQQYRFVAGRAAQALANAGAIKVPGAPPPGLRELSVIELAQNQALRPKLWPDYQQSWRRAGADAVLTELSSRFSLTLLPVVLMWARWRALQLPRRRWYSSAWPLVLSVPLLYGTYMILRAQERALADLLYLPRCSGPWLALTLMIVAAWVIDNVRRRDHLSYGPVG
jgi:hypothetical protein